jgi:modulator of FtsH protease
MNEPSEFTASSSIAVSEEQAQVVSVLKNTYLLLGMMLAFSSLTAWYSFSNNLPRPGILITLVGFYGLMFGIHKAKNSALGLVFAFGLTGFMGYTIGPIISAYVSAGAGATVSLALGMTAAVFVGMSAIAIITKKDFNFLGSFLLAGGLVLMAVMLISFIFSVPGLSLAVSAGFALFASLCMLYETSRIVRGGERNYMIAAVGLFVSIYNLFLSLLHLLGAGSGD